MLSSDEKSPSVFGGRHEAMYGILASSQHRAKVFQDASEIERAGFVTDVGATTASEALRNHIAGGSRMSNNALRTARKVWKQIKYNLEDRSVLELGSADDDLIEEIDAEQIKEIDADQIKDIEKAINDAISTLMATGSWPEREPRVPDLASPSC